jgi:Raf kinase inhibitor-like YbhB/YbcL family protein
VEHDMLEHLPAGVGRALRTARPGLEQIIFHDPEIGPQAASIEVTSPAFENFAELPMRYTKDGEGLSPAISWGSVPGTTQSVVIVIEDADSPTPAPLVHAIVWNLPAGAGALEEGALASDANAGDGLAMGKNSCMSAKYMAPDPPPGHGPHRYAIQVFALDTRPDLGSNPGRNRLTEHLRQHVLAKGLLVGTFERL